MMEPRSTKCRHTYQQILTLAAAASSALLAVSASILLLADCSWLVLLGLGFISTLSALIALACICISRYQPCNTLSWRGFCTYVLIKLFIVTVARYAVWNLRQAYKSRSAMRAKQEAALMKLVKLSRDTVFGRDHRFREIRGIDDYRALVPVRNYTDLDKYNQLAYRGEPDVFFPGRPDFLFKTSGTTGKNKTFAGSKRFKGQLLMNFASTMRCYEEFVTAHGRKSTMARQVALAVHPADKQNEFGVSVGPLSKFFQTSGDIYTTPDEVFNRVHDTETGFYLHAVFTLWHERVGEVNVFFPTSLITFLRCISANWNSVLTDIETGRLSEDKVQVDEELLSLLNQRLSPKPERAAQLRALFGDGQDLSRFFEKAWPGVPYLVLARSASFRSSYDFLKKFIGNVPIFCPCIIGTEGIIGLSLSVSGEHEADLFHPMLSGTFVEFIPVDADGNDLGQPMLAHELQLGGLYETVATSYNCYRLRVGDVIKVVKMDGCAPVFEISHRKSHVLSVHVEKTTEKSLQACVMLAAQRLGCQLVEFTAADCFLYEPIADVSLGTKYYVMFVELEGDKPLTDDEKLAFDVALRDSCENYKMFRDEGHIGAMLVVQVKSGAFAALRQEMMKLNKDISEVQFKMPRVLRSDEQVRCLLEQRL